MYFKILEKNKRLFLFYYENIVCMYRYKVKRYNTMYTVQCVHFKF